MNRSHFFNYIEENLSTLFFRIKTRGKINLLDLNIYSETFFANLINILLECDLKNINSIQQNCESIDLIDTHNKIIVQVSATCSKQKIENSLSKKILKDYTQYVFKFIAISEDASKLKDTTFNNPYSIRFNPNDDIYDLTSLLNIVLNSTINKQRQLYDFFRSELGNTVDIVKIDTNLASIINILSSEDFSNTIDSPEINSFEISRKIEFNKLFIAETTIEDYKIYYSKLNEKYLEFDKQGANKSLSVLNMIRKQYVKLSSKEDSNELFFSIIDEVIDIIINSKNYIEIPFEELEMCVSILVVDAFIKCKIFRNPEGYSHVITWQYTSRIKYIL